jgi:branched-chain amino acid transport system permease protein
VKTETVKPPVYQKKQYLSIAVFVILAGLIVPQLATSASAANLVDLWLVYALAGLGFYWIFGLGGRFAFCQTTMMATGAYTAAYAALHGWPFWASAAAGAAAAGVVALVIGVALARSQHFAFAIGTLAVSQVGLVVFNRSSDFTGVNGQVTNIPFASLFGHEFTTDKGAFWLFLGVLAIALLLTAWMERSPLGRESVAARDGELVARTAGVPVRRIHLSLFALGSALGGLSGALLAHWQGFVGVDSFGLDLGIGIFLMVILGGAGSLWGPVIGSAFYVWAPELMSGLDEYKAVVYGGTLLLMIMLCPQGLAGLAKQLLGYAKGRRRATAGG